MVMVLITLNGHLGESLVVKNLGDQQAVRGSNSQSLMFQFSSLLLNQIFSTFKLITLGKDGSFQRFSIRVGFPNHQHFQTIVLAPKYLSTKY